MSTAALWGILGAQILMEEWEPAAQSLNLLREIIDSKSFVAPLQQLQQRVWLIHWSLFVFFNHPSGRSGIIEWFFNDRYLTAIQMACPHVLRYLTVAVVTNKKKKNQMKDLIRVIEQEQYQYTDPITQFIEALHIQCDFSAAEATLKLAEQVLERDVFLRSLKDEFVENARLYIFESYCKIHNCMDLKLLAEKLSLNEGLISFSSFPSIPFFLEPRPRLIWSLFSLFVCFGWVQPMLSVGL
jgi:translation initiation factor 3 subunit E